MELLLSRIPPLRFSNKSFVSCFEELLPNTDLLRIASGYISVDSLIEIQRIIHDNRKPSLQLLIGMHYFEGFTRPQYEATKNLDDFLRSSKLGSVSLATVVKFHGKVYSFTKDSKPFASVVGSSNLNNILDKKSKTVETDMFLREEKMVTEIDKLLVDLSPQIGTELIKIKDEDIRIVTKSLQLEDHDGIEKISDVELTLVQARRTKTSFEIPLKPSEEAPQSNLNVFFGEGRRNARGYVLPRPWYEIEFIVSKEITSKPNYPKVGTVFTVYTDDCWKFNCKISGDYGKNFRSEDNLLILGRWLKGRLENSGCLKPNVPITRAVLQKYGRENVKLIATQDATIWLLDFKSPRAVNEQQAS